MRILGINSNLLHDSGAAVVIEGKLVAAVNEERLRRTKQQGGVPVRSVAEVLRLTHLTPGDVDEIRYVGFSPPQKVGAFLKTGLRLAKLLQLDLFRIGLSRNRFQSLVSRRLGPTDKHKVNLFFKVIADIWGNVQLVNRLKAQGFQGRVRYIPHHLCHLYAAYASSGFTDRSLVVNLEGTSFAYTTNLYVGEKGLLTEVVSTSDPHSSGHFYACFTEILGFRPGFHEGKVTGLSAWGRMKEKKSAGFTKLYEVVKRTLYVAGLELRVSPQVFLYPYYYSTYKQLPPELQGFNREEIAWAAQKRLEEVIVELVTKAIGQTDCCRVILTGGVAANVRMNQEIKQIPGVKEIFVYPAMGDFGNAHGAAVAPARVTRWLHPKVLLHNLTHVYLGSGYSDSQIREVLDTFGLRYELIRKDLPKILARFLSKGKIVCLFQGRMEYGPRALGNRSILADARSATVNERLNKALMRSDFMPFAPVILYEMRNICLQGVKGAEFAAEFMTMTFPVTEWLKKTCPAIVHVDGTARPQLIKRNVNPFYYDIVKEFYRLTGVPVLINTSFNMHEEPIVASPQDAVKSFLASGLDYLVMEKFLVQKVSQIDRF